VPKLPCVSGVRVVKALGRLGFVKCRQRGVVTWFCGEGVVYASYQFIGKLTKEHCAAYSAKLG